MEQPQPQRLATWNPARDVWETDQACICGHSDVWSETWPTSGTWADGTAYELPTSAHHMAVLPTPTARDWKNVGDPNKTAARMADRGQPLGEVVVNALLPSPRATDYKSGYASDGATAHVDKGQGTLGETAVVRHGTTAWGQYAAAIHRWEQSTRTAPPPTETGPKGNPRLSAAFSEWLMGLPAGWVTDVPGITRNEALRALGNGVVPQQAEAAIRTIFSRKAAA